VSAYRQSTTDHTMSSLACQALLTMVAGTLPLPVSSVAASCELVAHTSMPAVSPFGAKLPVPALVPSTPSQLRDFDAAGLRRANRLQARQQKTATDQNPRDARKNARLEASAAAAEATAAGKILVACCSTSVTQVRTSLLALNIPQDVALKSVCSQFCC
jgi:hypothetical protein